MLSFCCFSLIDFSIPYCIDFDKHGVGWPPSRVPDLNGNSLPTSRGIHLSWFGTVASAIYKRFSVAEGPVEYKKAYPWVRDLFSFCGVIHVLLASSAMG